MQSSGLDNGHPLVVLEFQQFFTNDLDEQPCEQFYSLNYYVLNQSKGGHKNAYLIPTF